MPSSSRTREKVIAERVAFIQLASELGTEAEELAFQLNERYDMNFRQAIREIRRVQRIYVPVPSKPAYAKRFLVLDTETTGLDPRVHVPWEIAYELLEVDWKRRRSVAIARGHAFMSITVAQRKAGDPKGMMIGGFAERYDRSILVTPKAIAATLTRLCADETTQLVGAVPSFDDEMLRHWVFWPTNRDRPWHYHLIDVETLGNGALSERFGNGFHRLSSDAIFGAFGANETEGRHTAEGDVQTARRLFEQVYGLQHVVNLKEQPWHT